MKKTRSALGGTGLFQFFGKQPPKIVHSKGGKHRK